MKTEISNAIQELTKISEMLQDVANDSENYNVCYNHYLQQYSWELFKMKENLIQIKYAFGGV